MSSSSAEMRVLLSEHARAYAEHTQIALAEAVVIRAVQQYWIRLARHELLIPSPPREASPLPIAISRAAERLGEVASQLPVPHAAYQLSLIYTSLLPPRWRSTHGIFYTPPALVERLFEQAEGAGLQWASARILDPAAGAGAFLVFAALRLSKELAGSSPPLHRSPFKQNSRL